MPKSKSYAEADQSNNLPRNAIDEDLGGSEDDSVGKDGAEIELEKAVFGDAKGFHDDLRFHQEKNAYFHELAEEFPDGDASALEEGGLEGLDDSAVRT